MKKILTILLITLATSTIAQTDSTIADTLSIDSYVTNRDSPDSTDIEMTWEEMDELDAYVNGKSNSRRKAEHYMDFPQSVVDNINQNSQDYTNFYYRKKRTTLIGLLLP